MCQSKENDDAQSTEEISTVNVSELKAAKVVEVKQYDAEDAQLPPAEYVKTRIFPVLLPILAEMLEEAQRRECFEVRSRFNAQQMELL
ncbi:unnamed protein product [Dibothriocephalus latus]|uniref:Uncharacterized protein n=1 Tax=Dibothriocephalus latus TaxID=60516 RepID=A0A3P7LTY2_DIBLA|nr:unnamed protein product [Dibothriocephalus latus]